VSARITAEVLVSTAGALAVASMVLVQRRDRRCAVERSLYEEALVNADRRALAGLIAAAVAHDANNLLTVVGADVDLLRWEEVRPSSAAVARIRTCVERLIALNQRLLDPAVGEGTRRAEPLDVVAAARESADSLATHPALRGCRVSIQGTCDVRVTADPVLWHQILANLLVNAGEASGGRGEIEVRVASRDGEVVLEVHDSGPGVPAEHRARLIGALESTKHPGIGLGLFSARACASQIGGRLEVDASPLGGAIFRLRAPVSAI
jgi:signal transduction histidine kinase